MCVYLCDVREERRNLLQRGNEGELSGYPPRRRKKDTQTHTKQTQIRTQTYWAVVLQGNAVQGVTLLDISGQVNNILHLLSGGAPPQPLSATWPQLIALPVLLWQVILWAIVSKQIGMTAIRRLHHGGRLEPIVLASTGHFFFTALGRAEISLSSTSWTCTAHSLPWWKITHLN